jgi:hypothetical protein
MSDFDTAENLLDLIIMMSSGSEDNVQGSLQNWQGLDLWNWPDTEPHRLSFDILLCHLLEDVFLEAPYAGWEVVESILVLLI